MTHENLRGRVAVVTGGGGVLCGQFAKTLAKQGCKVAVLDLNEEAAQKCVDEITADDLMFLNRNPCRTQEILLMRNWAPAIFF